MLALFGGFPIWWALGLSAVIWILFALPMLAWLLARGGRVRVPKGFGLWLAFLFWMLLSATQLDEARRWYAFSYRAVLYLSMTVMFVYVYNLPRLAMPTRRIVLALALFWAAVIGFGFAALAAPTFRLTTPVSLLLPSQRWPAAPCQDLISPSLAQVQTFIGYALTRPAAPFTYTNEWGGAVGLLTPMALAAIGLVRSYLTRNAIRLLLVASLVPIVISANRGLWVGLAAGLVYAAVRVALRGNARALVAIAGFLAVVTAMVAFTPLERYVGDRLSHQHSNERRESLSQQAVTGALERPLLGYGGTAGVGRDAQRPRHRHPRAGLPGHLLPGDPRPGLLPRLVAVGAVELPPGGHRAAPVVPRDAADRRARVLLLRHDAHPAAPDDGGGRGGLAGPGGSSRRRPAPIRN